MGAGGIFGHLFMEGAVWLGNRGWQSLPAVCESGGAERERTKHSGAEEKLMELLFCLLSFL